MSQFDSQNLKLKHQVFYKVNASTYTTDFCQLSKGIVFFQRKHTWNPNDRELDVFGKCWSVAWTNFRENEVSIYRLGKKIPICGPQAIFVPPFSIIDWGFGGGEINWQAIILDLEYSSDFPVEPFLFLISEQHKIPQTMNEILQFLRECESAPEKLTPINKIEKASGIAEKLRKYLNLNFEKEIPITEIADLMGVDHSVLDRSFKKAYGISPINFRNRMRILDSAHRLILGEGKVSSVCYDVGFSTVGNFNKQFKKFMKTTPSDFLID